ncbi:MAG: SRPBCC family protein [Actinomycetota bacterium]|nr:SRPBCC family protein [Actinomycetota bacterium]
MTEETVVHYRVSCVIPASAELVFAVLADPTRHRDFDGSGAVRDSIDTAPLTAEGQTFEMNMYNERVGDYVVRNHVRALKPNEEISWLPSSGGRPAAGHWWGYDVTAIDDNSCEVGLNYDWADVTDPRMMAFFPRSNQDQMQESLTQLQALFAS